MFDLRKKKFLYLFLFTIYTPVINSQWILDYDTTPPEGIIQNVQMLDTGTMWGLGYISFYPFDTTMIIVKSPQYGLNIFLPDLPYGVIYNCIAGINSDTAFVGSEFGKVYKTTNGYNFYEVLDAGSPDYVVNSIKYSKQNKSTGYILCSKPYGPASFVLFKTTNYGENWQTFTPNFGAGYYGGYAACVTDSAHVWYGLGCISSNCPYIRIAFTTNGGLNWLTSDQEPGRRAYTTITFKNDNQYGLSISHLNNSPSKISRSTNGGSNWIVLNNLISDFIVSGLISIPGSTVWYLAANGNDSNNQYYHIYKSINEGVTWHDMTFNINPELILDIDAVSSGGKIYSWASTARGIFRLVDTAITIGITNNNNNIPAVYRLVQNYPNPFNPVTTIKYEIPKDSKVKLVVYDLLGRKVKTLVNNEIKSAGYYKVEFNMLNYASGVYFYHIEVWDPSLRSGLRFIDAMKMVLIK